MRKIARMEYSHVEGQKYRELRAFFSGQGAVLDDSRHANPAFPLPIVEVFSVRAPDYDLGIVSLSCPREDGSRDLCWVGIGSEREDVRDKVQSEVKNILGENTVIMYADGLSYCKDL